MPVVATTSGTLHPETLRLLLRLRPPQDGRRRGVRRRELPEVAHDTRATLPAPRRDVRSTPDRGSAVQPPGLSYTAQWEALGCAPRLLTTPEISSTGPVRVGAFAPAPIAHVLAFR